MKGYIHFDSVEHEGQEGVQVSCHVQGVDVMDKFQMLESLCSALGVTEQEWMLYVCMKADGVFDQVLVKESVKIELPIKEGNQSEG